MEMLPQDLASTFIIVDPSAIQNVELFTGALTKLT